VDTRGKKRASRGICRAAALDPSECAIVREPERKSDEKEEEANLHDDMTTVCETAAPPCQRRIRSAPVSTWLIDRAPSATMKSRSILVLIFLGAADVTLAAWSLETTEQLSAPAGITFMRRTVRNEANRKVELHLVEFSTAQHTCVVMDNPAGELTLATGAKKRGALAAVNGGYFHPDRTPLGLVVRDGKTLHPMERATLLSGLVVMTARSLSLQRAGEFKQDGSVRNALQAGPFLVDKGHAVPGLNAARFAARTVVVQLAGTRRGLMTADSVTLAEMGDLLAVKGLAVDGQIVRALNLDGGSSTGLWVRSDPEFYLREHKEVRNYLGIVPVPARPGRLSN